MPNSRCCFLALLCVPQVLRNEMSQSMGYFVYSPLEAEVWSSASTWVWEVRNPFVSGVSAEGCDMRAACSNTDIILSKISVKKSSYIDGPIDY